MVLLHKKVFIFILWYYDDVIIFSNFIFRIDLRHFSYIRFLMKMIATISDAL